MVELSDGHALHAIMIDFQQATVDTIMKGWQAALGGDGSDLDTYRRHAEVVGLVRGVSNQVLMLPNVKTRDRLWQYVPQWFEIILAPRIQWHAAVDLKAHADGNSLDHLASAADILAHDLAGTNMALQSGDLSELRRQVQNWILDMQDSGSFEDLPEMLRRSLLKDFEHLLWLIDNAATFGAARAVQHAERMSGTLTIASGHLKSNDTFQGWKERLVAFGAAIVFLTGSMTAGTAAINSALDFGAAVHKVIEKIDLDGYGVPSAPKEITSGSERSERPLALSDGSESAAGEAGEVDV